MDRIESPANPRVRTARRIRDSRSEQALLEGKKLVSEAIDSKVKLEDVFVTERFLREENTFAEILKERSENICLVSARAMKSMSDVETPPGLIAIASLTTLATRGVPKTFGAFLFSIRDPGNLGTILRVAEAAGCEFLAFTADCVHPSNPKVIRASSGSIFRVPLLEVTDVNTYFQSLRQQGVSICGLATGGEVSLFHIHPQFPVLAVIGSESHGLPRSLKVDEMWSIPMKGKTESLNAAMAATLCLYRLGYAFRSDTSEH